MTQRLTLTALLLLIAGCTTSPTLPPAADPMQVWRSHQQELAGIDRWLINGRLAIITEEEGWHTNITWQQSKDGYHIIISGPFGSGSVKLEGDKNGVVLTDDDGTTILARDAEQLLWQQYGWRVPVNSLRHWVMGLPGPGESDYRLNQAGYLEHLSKTFWKVDFHDYRQVDGHMLPRKVFAHDHQAKVKLIVSEWTFNEPTPDQ